MIAHEQRVASKLYRCRCGALIRPGDAYLHSVASPNHGDLGNLGWWRERECRDCAARYGRWAS